MHYSSLKTLASLLLNQPIYLWIQKLHLSANEGELISDASQYRCLIGSLLYLTVSRPDITFVVHKLSQFISMPRVLHLQAAYYLVRYLKYQPGQGLFFPSSSSLQLNAFSDADWASCPDSRESVLCFCIFLGDFLVSWKAKKWTTISRSSIEADYRALAITNSEIIWLQQLLTDFGITSSPSTLLFCDNRATIQIASNPTFHERTKHIEIDLHFVRDKVTNGSLKLLSIWSQHQLADIFTKPLSSKSLLTLLSKMPVKDIYSPSCGGVLHLSYLLCRAIAWLHTLFQQHQLYCFGSVMLFVSGLL